MVITLLSCFCAQSLHLNHDYRADFGHNDGQGEDQQRGKDAWRAIVRLRHQVRLDKENIWQRFNCGKYFSHPAANMEGTQAVVAIVRAEPFVTGKLFFNIELNRVIVVSCYLRDQVNIDKWKGGVPFRAVDNFWVTVRVAYPNVIIML